MSIITVNDFKQYRGIESNTDDSLILSIINAAEKWLEDECDRPLVVTADSVRTFDSYGECVDGDTLIFDDVIASITQITIDGTELTSSEYTTVPRNKTPYREVKIKRSVNKTWADDNAVGDYVAEDAIQVTGKWGYYEEAPENVKHMVRRLVSYAYSQKDATVFDVIQVVDGVANIPQGFPQDIGRFVNHHRSLV